MLMNTNMLQDVYIGKHLKFMEGNRDMFRRLDV